VASAITVLGSERLTGAALGRLTHRCTILESAPGTAARWPPVADCFWEWLSIS
jgi:hypothetical protein